MSAIFMFLGFGWAQLVSGQTATPTPSAMCCLPANPWVTPAVTVSAGVAVDTTRGRVYVTDRGNNTGDGWVRALNYDGTPAASFGNGGSVTVAGAFQVAVGKGAYDGVYVLQRDTGTGVTKLDSNGNLVWGRNPIIPGSWRAICVDDWGNVYAATDSAGIIVWDNNGNQKGVSFSGTLGIPSGLCASGLNLYVADTTNFRIVQFTQTGVNTYTYNSAQTVTLGTDPYGITKDLTGHFYVAVKSWMGFAAFDSNFTPLTQPCSSSSMQGAYEIAVNDTGAVYVGANISNAVTKIQACFLQTLPTYHGINPPASGECFIYPSPAKGDHATVSYKMAESGRVELKVWNEKAELVDDVTDQKSPGVQVTPFGISGLSSGVYFYTVILTYDSGAVEKLKPHKFVIIH